MEFPPQYPTDTAERFCVEANKINIFFLILHMLAQHCHLLGDSGLKLL